MSILLEKAGVLENAHHYVSANVGEERKMIWHRGGGHTGWVLLPRNGGKRKKIALLDIFASPLVNIALDHPAPGIGAKSIQFRESSITPRFFFHGQIWSNANSAFFFEEK